FPMKRPTPCDVAMFGSLDVHAAVMLTFTEATVAMQTKRSPASMVGALQVSASLVPGGDSLGAVGTLPPHADAIDTAALRGAMRLIRMTPPNVAAESPGRNPARFHEAGVSTVHSCALSRQARNLGDSGGTVSGFDL